MANPARWRHGLLRTAAVLVTAALLAATGATPATASGSDLQVAAVGGTGPRTVSTGSSVASAFTLGGLPAGGAAAELAVALGESFEFVGVTGTAGGAALVCSSDPAEPQWATCTVPTGSTSVDLTVMARAVRPGTSFQYVQVTATIPGSADPTPSDAVAWIDHLVLSADVQVLVDDANTPVVPRGSSPYPQGPRTFGLDVATTRAVPVEVVLSGDPGGAALDGLVVSRAGPNGTRSPLSCTGALSPSTTCALGTIAPGTVDRLEVTVTAPASAPVGGIATVHATVRPTPGSGAGLTTSTADAQVVVGPSFRLAATITSPGAPVNGSGSSSSVGVTVGRPGAVRVTLTNSGSDPAPPTAVELVLTRRGQHPSTGERPLLAVTAGAAVGTVVQSDERTVTWAVDDVPAGGSRVLDLEVSADRTGYDAAGQPYSEDLVVRSALSQFVAGPARYTQQPDCTVQRDEPGRCWLSLVVSRSTTVVGRPGSNDDTDADGYADALGTTHDGALLLYPNGYAAGDAAPFTDGWQVGSGWQGLSQASAGDVDGDGDADVVATDGAGTLWMYENGLADGAATPFDSGQVIGGGWRGYPQLVTGDISGDGAADLIATDPGGRLRYFPNNRATNPGHVPYSAGITFGGGWQGYTHVVAGDISGDGAADLLATGPDGRLWYFPNNSGSNPGHVPFVHGTVIGNGWQGFRQVQVADLDGDGLDDLLAVGPSGDLLQFTNTGGANAGRPPFITSRQVGSGWDVFRLLL